MSERDRSRGAVVDDRLGVRPVRAAGRRVARVADRDLARQRRELLLVEDLRDETHLAEHGDPPPSETAMPGGLLAAVLEREEPEVRETRDVALARVDAEDAAHQRLAPSYARASSSQRDPEERVAADRPDPPHVDLAAGRIGLDLVRGQSDDHLAADLAEERERIVVELELRAERRSRAPPRRARRRGRPRRRRGRARRAGAARVA